MISETAALARELRWIVAEVARALLEVNPAQRNDRPIASANSPVAIATHVHGCTRAWVLGIACGLPVRRDRPAEFASFTPDVSDLIAGLTALGSEIDTSLDRLSAQDLDRRSVPSRELWGNGDIQEISTREAIVEAIRHAALHLGEVRLTRDLLDAGGPTR